MQHPRSAFRVHRIPITTHAVLVKRVRPGGRTLISHAMPLATALGHARTSTMYGAVVRIEPAP